MVTQQAEGEVEAVAGAKADGEQDEGQQGEELSEAVEQAARQGEAEGGDLPQVKEETGDGGGRELPLLQPTE